MRCSAWRHRAWGPSALRRGVAASAKRGKGGRGARRAGAGEAGGTSRRGERDADGLGSLLQPGQLLGEDTEAPPPVTLFNYGQGVPRSETARRLESAASLDDISAEDIDQLMREHLGANGLQRGAGKKNAAKKARPQPRKQNRPPPPPPPPPPPLPVASAAPPPAKKAAPKPAAAPAKKAAAAPKTLGGFGRGGAGGKGAALGEPLGDGVVVLPPEPAAPKKPSKKARAKANAEKEAADEAARIARVAADEAKRRSDAEVSARRAQEEREKQQRHAQARAAAEVAAAEEAAAKRAAAAAAKAKAEAEAAAAAAQAEREEAERAAAAAAAESAELVAQAEAERRKLEEEKRRMAEQLAAMQAEQDRIAAELAKAQAKAVQTKQQQQQQLQEQAQPPKPPPLPVVAEEQQAKVTPAPRAAEEVPFELVKASPEAFATARTALPPTPEQLKHLDELRESREQRDAIVVQTNSAGVIAVLEGVRGFIPFSQLGEDLTSVVERASMMADPHAFENQAKQRQNAMLSLMGAQVSVWVLEVQPDGKSTSAVLSAKAYTPMDVDESLKRLRVGQIVDAKVTDFAPFGAFCRVRGVPGLVHVSEIAWKRPAHPADVLMAGEIVKAKVVGIDADKGNISLSIRLTQPDPLLETLDTLVKTESDDFGTIDSLPQVASICRLLVQQEGVLTAVPSKHFTGKTFAPDLQLLLSETEEEDAGDNAHSFRLLARLGFDVQEVVVTAALSREELRALVVFVSRRLS